MYGKLTLSFLMCAALLLGAPQETQAAPDYASGPYGCTLSRPFFLDDGAPFWLNAYVDSAEWGDGRDARPANGRLEFSIKLYDDSGSADGIYTYTGSLGRGQLFNADLFPELDGSEVPGLWRAGVQVEGQQPQLPCLFLVANNVLDDQIRQRDLRTGVPDAWFLRPSALHSVEVRCLTPSVLDLEVIDYQTGRVERSALNCQGSLQALSLAIDGSGIKLLRIWSQAGPASYLIGHSSQ